MRTSISEGRSALVALLSLAIAPIALAQPLENIPIDPDRGLYAPDEVPPVRLQRVSLVQDFEWVLGGADNSESVEFTGANAMRIHFTPCTEERTEKCTNLGDKSSIVLTATSGNFVQTQTLNSESLERRKYNSIVFNGDKVQISVREDPGDQIVSVFIEEVTIEERPPIRPDGQPIPQDGGAPGDSSEPDDPAETLITPDCDTDMRSSSEYSALGRTIYPSCTGWILSNGAHLTAGHCAGDKFVEILFNVPESKPNGHPLYPSAEDVYLIDLDTLVWENADPDNGHAGEDWAIFDVLPNDETGMLPVHTQQAFFRITNELTPEAVAVIGFGHDSDPAGEPPNTIGNSSNYTEQVTTPTEFKGEIIEGPSDSVIKYTLHSPGGSSGGSVIDTSNLAAIGIHTNRCGSASTAAGTGFKNGKLADVIQSFLGPDVIYVDKGHPVSTEDGTIFRPYKTLDAGLKAVGDAESKIISIVTGQYFYDAELLTGKDVTFIAPVGPVTFTRN